MKIDHPNYQGDCRRSNGKLKLAFRDWVWVFSTATILLTSGAIGWTKINGKVEIHDEKLAKVEQAPKDIAVIKNDMGNMQEDIEEIKTAQMIIQTDQKTLQKEMSAGFKEILLEIKNNR